MTSTETFSGMIQDTFDDQGLKLVYNFFLAFSRFEGALKSSNFLLFNKHVQADWNGFENFIKGKFDPDVRQDLRAAVDFIMLDPPKIQTIIGNNLAWRNRVWPNNTPQVNILGQAIRDIRNNLFHGSKFQGNFQPDISRNYNLINSALIIIDEWLELEPNLKNQFLLPII